MLGLVRGQHDEEGADCHVAQIDPDIEMTEFAEQMREPRGCNMARKQIKIVRDTPIRGERLGFRVDRETKVLIERAAHLERRKLTEFCVATLANAARRTIAEHEMLVLSERDRQAFFDALINRPKPNKRLVHALAEHKRRVVASE
jgi:uncharacterized protein (DUF1778 family)